MLTQADVFNLIVLVNKELDQLQLIIDNSKDDEEVSDAGEAIIQISRLEPKLKSLYEEQHQADSNFPSYDELMQMLEG